MTSNMIVFGEDWGGHPSSTQHLIKHLSRSTKTLWVNSIGLRRPQFCRKDMSRLYQKGRALFKRVPATSMNATPFKVVAPKVLPWPANPMARFLNKTLLSRQLDQKMREMGMKHPLVWASLPTAIDVINALQCGPVIYYCGDDFGALDGVDHKPVRACEKRLVARADLIIAASARLARKFPQDKTLILPHGVDYDLFATPTDRVPECYSFKPIAGFYGSIAPWLDLELIAETARLRPDWTFMFVGHIKCDVSMLRPLKNVRFEPAQAHERLPGFVQHWQAALLPFKDNEQIRACNPLKLREYLASGCPVVSTDFPALNPYRKHVHVVRTATEFSNCLNTLQADPAQRDCVARESWAAQADQLEDVFGKRGLR